MCVFPGDGRWWSEGSEEHLSRTSGLSDAAASVDFHFLAVQLRGEVKRAERCASVEGVWRGAKHGSVVCV